MPSDDGAAGNNGISHNGTEKTAIIKQKHNKA